MNNKPLKAFYDQVILFISTHQTLSIVGALYSLTVILWLFRERSWSRYSSQQHSQIVNLEELVESLSYQIFAEQHITDRAIDLYHSSSNFFCDSSSKVLNDTLLHSIQNLTTSLSTNESALISTQQEILFNITSRLHVQNVNENIFNQLQRPSYFKHPMFQQAIPFFDWLSLCLIAFILSCIYLEYYYFYQIIHIHQKETEYYEKSRQSASTATTNEEPHTKKPEPYEKLLEIDENLLKRVSSYTILHHPVTNCVLLLGIYLLSIFTSISWFSYLCSWIPHFLTQFFPTLTFSNFTFLYLLYKLGIAYCIAHIGLYLGWNLRKLWSYLPKTRDDWMTSIQSAEWWGWFFSRLIGFYSFTDTQSIQGLFYLGGLCWFLLPVRYHYYYLYQVYTYLDDRTLQIVQHCMILLIVHVCYLFGNYYYFSAQIFTQSLLQEEVYLTFILSSLPSASSSSSSSSTAAAGESSDASRKEHIHTHDSATTTPMHPRTTDDDDDDEVPDREAVEEDVQQGTEEKTGKTLTLEELEEKYPVYHDFLQRQTHPAHSFSIKCKLFAFTLFTFTRHENRIGLAVACLLVHAVGFCYELLYLQLFCSSAYGKSWYNWWMVWQYGVVYIAGAFAILSVFHVLLNKEKMEIKLKKAFENMFVEHSKGNGGGGGGGSSSSVDGHNKNGEETMNEEMEINLRSVAGILFDHALGQSIMHVFFFPKPRPESSDTNESAGKKTGGDSSKEDDESYIANLLHENLQTEAKIFGMNYQKNS